LWALSFTTKIFPLIYPAGKKSVLLFQEPTGIIKNNPGKPISDIIESDFYPNKIPNPPCLLRWEVHRKRFTAFPTFSANSRISFKVWQICIRICHFHAPLTIINPKFRFKRNNEAKTPSDPISVISFNFRPIDNPKDNGNKDTRNINKQQAVTTSVGVTFGMLIFGKVTTMLI
jgi:hypothetical protein